MGNYRFRSDELYKEPLPKDRVIDKKVEEPITQQPFDVPIESKPKTHKKITTSRLRVRKEPNGEVIKILDNNVEVEIVKERGDGWAQLIDGTYVMSMYLK